MELFFHADSASQWCHTTIARDCFLLWWKNVLSSGSFFMLVLLQINSGRLHGSCCFYGCIRGRLHFINLMKTMLMWTRVCRTEASLTDEIDSAVIPLTDLFWIWLLQLAAQLVLQHLENGCTSYTTIIRIPIIVLFICSCAHYLLGLSKMWDDLYSEVITIYIISSLPKFRN